tara:strand:- start:244 stop:438 length:195 start_codon:yes stop_codon:yes gene_type:complete
MKKLILISALLISFNGWTDENNITEVRITMSDGVQLAADIYWPAGADKKDRFPILLEYISLSKG